MRMRGEKQPGVHAEDLPAETFEIHGDAENMEAAVWTGTSRRRPVGWIDHDPAAGTIGTVYVHPAFRGKGLGPRLREAAGNPPHSPNLTEEGERFARKTGDAPKAVVRQPPLDEAGHQAMLPDFANWISQSPTARRVQ